MIIEHIGIEGILDLIPKYHTLEETWPRIAQLAEHWTSIPKVGLTFQPARCGYTLRVTSKTLYSPEYITSKHTQLNYLFLFCSDAFL